MFNYGLIYVYMG